MPPDTDEGVPGGAELSTTPAPPAAPHKGRHKRPAKPSGNDLAKNQEDGGLFKVTNSPTFNTLMLALQAGNNLADIPRAHKQITRSANTSIEATGNARRLTQDDKNNRIVLTLEDFEKFVGSNKPAKKMLVWTMIKANEQAIHNGVLSRDHITFPLQDLVDAHLYKNLQTARQGFKKGIDVLTGVKVSGDFNRRHKKDSFSIVGAHPIRFGAIKNNQCAVYLEDKTFDWRVMSGQFTVIPRYYFELGNRASDLLYYIFFLARQSSNQESITDKGYFNISLRAIQARLLLPDEAAGGNVWRDIRDTIKNAVEEISNIHKKYHHADDFILSLDYDVYAPIETLLDTGFLRVSLSGDFARCFEQANANRTEQIKKRQDRIDKAKAKALAEHEKKKLEAADKKKESETADEKSGGTGEKPGANKKG